MPTRKHFIAAAAIVPLLGAAPAPTTSPLPTASKSSPAPSKTKISSLAREFASRMREFDPSLSDKELDTIAAGIDGNLEVGPAINRKGRVLKNWDEPVTTFEVPE